MKKVLFVATTLSHISRFHIPYLKFFKDNGYTVHAAASFTEETDLPYCDELVNLPFDRSFGSGNIKAYKPLKNMIDVNNYEIIHCHTPIASAVTRLAARNAHKRGTVVIYTCHGFRFHKGSSVFSWLLFYPVERILSRFTDCLITMNSEDYNISKKFHAKRIEKINGIGVDLERFELEASMQPENKKMLGLSDEDFVLCYVADLKKMKNQEFLIRSMPDLIKEIPNVKLVLTGIDMTNGKITELAASLSVSDNILFMGERDDIPQILNAADVYVSASTREGLPASIIEASSANKPIVATKIRGHVDLIEDGMNGILFKPNDKKAFINAVSSFYRNERLRVTTGKTAGIRCEKYGITIVSEQMDRIYSCFML